MQAVRGRQFRASGQISSPGQLKGPRRDRSHQVRRLSRAPPLACRSRTAPRQSSVDLDPSHLDNQDEPAICWLHCGRAKHGRHPGHPRHADPEDAQPGADARLRDRAADRAGFARSLQGESRLAADRVSAARARSAGWIPSGGRPRTRGGRSSIRSRAPARSSSRSRPPTGRGAATAIARLMKAEGIG